MINETSRAPNSRLHAFAVVLASLIIPVPILTGKVVEAVMDSTNPAGLTDLSVPLAYLSEILVSSFAVLGMVIVLFLIATIMLVVRSKSWRSAMLPIVLAAIQIVVGVTILILDGVISGVDGS